MSPNDTNGSTDLLYVSWAEDCSRSDATAKRLGGISHMVYSPEYGSKASTILFKYLSQGRKTWRLLGKTAPRLVFVMSPPFTAAVPIWLYSLFHPVKFVIDAHTGAFDNPRWKKLWWAQAFFCRRAQFTIVTNQHLADTVERWGGQARIVTDVPVDFPEPVAMPLPEGCNMTFVCTFTPDEPLDLFFEAASKTPDINFHVTGDHTSADPQLLARKPDNVHLTGFISRGQFAGLLLGTDAAISLTTRDHTMQRGAYEATYLKRPVITSNFQILRDAFPMGTVHVELTPDDLVRGFREMKDNLPRLTEEAAELCARKHQRWGEVAVQIRSELGSRVQESPA